MGLVHPDQETGLLLASDQYMDRDSYFDSICRGMASDRSDIVVGGGFNWSCTRSELQWPDVLHGNGSYFN